MKLTIVAEISKNYPETADSRDPGKCVAMLFEEVITRNAERGYSLRDWRFSQTATPTGEVIESIIAVFDLRDSTGGGDAQPR